MCRLWVAGIFACFAQTAEACTKFSFPIFRSATGVNFIGAASGDTVLAGAGPVKVASAGKRRPIFGQIVRVERISAVAPASLAALARRGSLDVVLVPWTYGADCAPMPWDRSARWITAETRNLFSGTLRDRSEWIGGRPTLDVHDPYAVPGVVTRRDATDRVLTPDETLDLFDVLPLAERRENADAVRAAAGPLLKWAHEHPDLIARSPAKDILTLVRHDIALAIIRGKRSGVAGTYRFVITMPGGDSAVFFARTEEFAMHGLPGITKEAPETYSADGIPESVGYYLLAEAATSERGLTARNAGTEAGLHNQGYLAFIEQPIHATPDSTIWRGSVDLIGPASHATRNARIGAALDHIEKEMDALIQTGALSFAEGRFITYPNGRVRYEARVSGAGGLLFAMHGERISTAMLTPH